MPTSQYETDVLDQLEHDFTPSVTSSAQPAVRAPPSVHRNLVPLGSQELEEEEEEPPVASGDYLLTSDQQDDMRRKKHSELIEGVNEGTQLSSLKSATVRTVTVLSTVYADSRSSNQFPAATHPASLRFIYSLEYIMFVI
jgi:hypothetical protein